MAFDANAAVERYQRGRRDARGMLLYPGGPNPTYGWQAFEGALGQQADAAAANGMNVRTDLTGIGDGGGMARGRLGVPADEIDTRTILGNLGLTDLVDQNRRQMAQADAAQGAREQEPIDQMRASYAQQVAASAVPRAPAPVTTGGVDTAGNAIYTMRPNPTETPMQRLQSLAPGAMQPALQQTAEAQKLAEAKQAESAAATNAKIETETGIGSMSDYLRRTAAAAGKNLRDLSPQEIDTARQEYLDTTATAGANSPKVQDALEQQARGQINKEFSARSGGLGTQDAKVNAAIHLMNMFDQYKDKKTGEYNIPKAQYGELATGLASLISGSGQATDSQRTEILQRTAQGDLNNLLTYATGTPMNGSTQDIFKNLRESIERQGRTAEKERQTYVEALKSSLPTRLSEDRRNKLSGAFKLNSIDAPSSGKTQTIGKYQVEIH